MAIVIGGYTSASRVSMIPVFEENDALLFYGTYYEGLECSPNCFYGGAVPNQFLTNYVPWVMENLGTKFYIVGSDYIYPRTVSAIVQKLVKEGGGEIVADKYFPLGTTEFGPTVADIKAKVPTVLFSNMVGDSTIAFYKQFSNAGFTPETLPIAATVTTEVEVQAMGVEFAKGNYMTATYFQSLDNPANTDFVAAYKAQYGADAVTHMPLADTYQSVYLFADAASRIIDDGGDVYDTDTLKKYLVGPVRECARRDHHQRPRQPPLQPPVLRRADQLHRAVRHRRNVPDQRCRSIPARDRAARPDSCLPGTALRDERLDDLRIPTSCGDVHQHPGSGPGRRGDLSPRRPGSDHHLRRHGRDQPRAGRIHHARVVRYGASGIPREPGRARSSSHRSSSGRSASLRILSSSGFSTTSRSPRCSAPSALRS